MVRSAKYKLGMNRVGAIWGLAFLSTVGREARWKWMGVGYGRSGGGLIRSQVEVLVELFVHCLDCDRGLRGKGRFGGIGKGSRRLPNQLLEILAKSERVMLRNYQSPWIFRGVFQRSRDEKSTRDSRSNKFTC